MSFNHKNKIWFIHIPKNGGSSIRNWLDLESESLKIGQRKYDRGTRIHSNFRFQSEYNSNFKTFEDYFKFCIVRNPWDRAVSIYYNYIKDNKQPYFYKWNVNPNPKFGDIDNFKKWFLDVYYNLYKFNDNKISYSNRPLHFLFLPQYYFVIDKSGSIAVDFVGRFEDLKSSLDRVQHQFRIFETPPVLNSSEKKYPYTHYYDDELIDKSHSLFKSDLEYFKYNF